MAKKKTKKKTVRRRKSIRGAKTDFMKTLMPIAAGAIVGGIGANMISNFVPVTDERIKAAIPLAGGLAALYFGKGQLNFITGLGAGMSAAGGGKLLKVLVPALPITGQILGSDTEYIMIDEPQSGVTGYNGYNAGSQIMGYTTGSEYPM